MLRMMDLNILWRSSVNYIILSYILSKKPKAAENLFKTHRKPKAAGKSLKN